MQGLLIIGHGTRHPDGLAEFHATVDLVARRLPHLAVEPSFLELAHPTIERGVQNLVDRGAADIVAVPLLLFSAGHARRDIPEQLEKAQRQTGSRVRIAQTLDCHPALLELSARRWQQALEQAPHPAEQTLLLMVGRGSYDCQANAEMARFARLRWERAPAGWLETAFTAMAEPSVERSVHLIVRMGFPQVVVQPHLLFQGELVERIRSVVRAAAADAPRICWITTSHLGPAPQLAEAVVDRALAVVPSAEASAIARPEVCG